MFFFSREAGKKKHTLFFPKFSDFCLCFFFCSCKSSYVIHSFDLRFVFFFFRSPGKKIQHFHSFNRFCQKMWKIWTFTGKKKIRYLCPPPILSDICEIFFGRDLLFFVPHPKNNKSWPKIISQISVKSWFLFVFNLKIMFLFLNWHSRFRKKIHHFPRVATVQHIPRENNP